MISQKQLRIPFLETEHSLVDSALSTATEFLRQILTGAAVWVKQEYVVSVQFIVAKLLEVH